MMKLVFNFLLLFILFTSFASGEEFFISGIREVSNELHLSDFQLGSQERIKDQTGFGSSLGWVSGSVSDLAYVDIELGSSETLYQGEIEDAVNVEFKTTTGGGSGVVSSSKNIVYDVDLKFKNHFIAFSFTHIGVAARLWAERIPVPPTIMIGYLNQTAEGAVDIKTVEGTQLARASYKPGTYFFYGFGASLSFELLFLKIMLRNVPAPILEIKDCDSQAIGSTACDKILRATGNRNQSEALFTGGILTIGMKL